MTDLGGTGPVRGDGPVRDDDAVAWLRDAGLSHGRRDVGGLVPAGFAAYARLHHEDGWPGTGGLGHAEVRLAGRLAAATETPERLWVLVDEIEHHVPGDGSTAVLRRSYLGARWWRRVRHRLPLARPPWSTPAERAQLARQQDLRTRFGVDLAGTFFLYPARFDPAGPGGWAEVSYAWPHDRTWVTVTNVDCPSTYVGGSAELIAEVLADGALVAEPAELTDPWHGHG